MLPAQPRGAGVAGRRLSRRRVVGAVVLTAGVAAAAGAGPAAAQEATPTAGVPAAFKVVLHAAQSGASGVRAPQIADMCSR